MILVMALLICSSAPTTAAAPIQTRGDKFEAAACATFKITSKEFECGYVRVPEFHAEPNGKEIKLAVAILPGLNAATRDAFVVAQGGPGGSTLDTFVSFFQPGYYPAVETLRAERDIVLYDQRGTLYAQPALTCPEELELTLRTIEQEIPDEEANRQYEEAALACRARLVQAGVNLDAYNSIENALDIEDVRRALGYDKFDFYGVSYGTLLALHGLRETPDVFRSVILDAVVPAQRNPNSEIAQSENRAFEQLFHTCAADAKCGRAYPNLKQVFYAQVDALNEKPARVPVTDSAPEGSGKTYNAVIDGDAFMDLLFQFIYNTELVPALPQMIFDAREGRYTFVEAFYPTVVFDRTFASGMYYSVMCAEDADFTLNDLAPEGVDPHIAKAQARDTAAFLELCQKWNVRQLGARADEPVTAQVPTLVLSGDFDPITPPPFGQEAANTIRPSYVLEFPAYGHGALTSGNCADEIVAEFVRQPERAPDTRCIARDASQVAFITPADYMLEAGVGKMQLAMLQGKIEKFIVPIVLSLLLLSVWVVAPIAWVVRHSQKRPSEPHLLARLTPWLAALTALLAPAFFALVFGLVLVVALQNENVAGLVLGAPRGWAAVYVLPLVLTVCAIGLTLAVMRAWQRGNWGTWRRVYYAALAVVSLGLVVWLGLNGALTIALLCN